MATGSKFVAGCKDVLDLFGHAKSRALFRYQIGNRGDKGLLVDFDDFGELALQLGQGRDL